MDSNINPPRDLLVFQLTREIVNLSKSFLVILEDLRDFEQLIGDKSFISKRKKVLDNSNDTIRKLNALLEHFEVNLRPPIK